ncbi:MAG: hypothetical protein U0800_26885 [Isosphaeraceae bacterium]
MSQPDPPCPIDRRRFLLAALASTALGRGARADDLPPARAVTKGPRHHWFGYYDKLEFDPAGRYLLGMEVDFEHRSPRPDDSIAVGLVDLRDGDRWTELGRTTAWNWQQGCMLQWLPGSETEVLWNDRDGDRFVARILDVTTGGSRTIPAPIYAISPDATWAVAPDFRRLHDTRPGYGYAGIPDPNARIDAPDDAGIWRTDLASGKVERILTFRQVAELPYDGLIAEGPKPADSKHWFNHLLVSPDGSRFVFLHRWKTPEAKTWLTRMITCKPDGTDLYVLNPSGMTSHFIWRDPTHILAWALHPSRGPKFCVFEDKTRNIEVVGPDAMTQDGHCTYLPGHGDRWIVNDTYPDAGRLQHPYLFDTKTGRRHPLGHFASPPGYNGEWRVDTHPRSSPDGRLVAIDSPHGGDGRQLYVIDVSGIVGGR